MVDTVSSTDEQPTGDKRVATAQYGSTTPVADHHVVEVDCTVWRPMNSHGGVTLWETAGHRTFHVVEYARPSIRTAMARATGTTALRVRLVPLNSRGETWRAVGVTPNP